MISEEEFLENRLLDPEEYTLIAHAHVGPLYTMERWHDALHLHWEEQEQLRQRAEMLLVMAMEALLVLEDIAEFL